MATVLVIEDEHGMDSYLKTELQFENYQVLIAYDGVAGLQMYQDNPQIDVILLDWMLPKMDGLELLRRIRKNDDVPIIMMTARDYVSDKVAGLDYGADDYITKPFKIEELMARIRVVLRRKGQPGNEITMYQINNLKLDTKAHSVLKDDQFIQLSQREYKLLLVLMKHADQVISRDELLDEVWGTNYEGGTNILDVYIRHLREKIDDSKTELIHTVRGIGYTMRHMDEKQA
ncbi:response regulator transcription factor [Paucilactobacillus suebicus]|uniref:Winged helix family two component transcriptional regulator n=1 Tax=Paucilactobacillus suebicus DSM 5007 = KCTC 3549 TaxID=1423807 RepID=A0A0R1W3T2_9LACO|nr:response regulator transcription factor [Paucilactobacillus suebicus]KRM12314.1 winged helix family two component transcriptional regulator [Paucilactobacillus suebicus DSM 5007 = KCTC 3549]